MVITGDKPRDMEGSESGAILDSAYHDQEGGGGEPRLPAQDTNLRGLGEQVSNTVKIVF